MAPPSVPLDAIQHPAVLYDADGRIVAANDLADALAGRPLTGLSAAEVARIYDVRSPDGTPLPAPGLPALQALAGAEFVDVPLVATYPDGRAIEILATASLVREGGAITGALVLWQDVTEQVKAGEVLRESEERLRLAQEGAGIGIWDRDAATDRVTVALGLRQHYGLESEAMASYADWERLIHPDDRECVEAGRQAALVAGEPLDLEFRFVIPPGEVRWVQLRARGMGDGRGDLVRVVGVITDVTERRQAEAALVESEADPRSFFENMVDACAICETVLNDHGEPIDIRLIEVNPAFERELSLPADLIVGQTAFMILPTLHREWLDLFLEVSRQRTFIQVEDPYPALDRRYHLTAFPVRQGRAAVVFRDITGERSA